MLLIAILTLTLVFLGAALILTISVGGAIAILIFGDVIVCAVFIVFIIRFLINKRKK